MVFVCIRRCPVKYWSFVVSYYFLKGGMLDKELMIKARKAEIEFFRRLGVYTKVARESWMKVVTTKWVDTNKGDDANPRYRSRLVARQLKARDNSGASYFAPTPPIEAVRSVLSLAVTTVGNNKPCFNGYSEQRTQVSFVDVFRAYFNARTNPEDEPCYVELPAEDPDAGVQCGLLLRHMYGTRSAADGW